VPLFSSSSECGDLRWHGQDALSTVLSTDGKNLEHFSIN
jgi:hypothetical protein